MSTRLGFTAGCLLLGYSFASPANAVAQATGGTCPECDEVVRRVERLMPRRPERVKVIDVGRQPPALRRRIERAEAFVLNGENAVYLKRQGPTFQRALGGEGIWDYALAVIIWHEMAHLGGADEQEAQRQEELLWKRFVLERRVDARRGLLYLRLLRARAGKTSDLLAN